jgi:hypothetical protein
MGEFKFQLILSAVGLFTLLADIVIVYLPPMEL